MRFESIENFHHQEKALSALKSTTIKENFHYVGRVSKALKTPTVMEKFHKH